MRNAARRTYLVAAALSLALLYFMYVVGFQTHDVRKLSLSDIGGWLSGFASSLAFIWLVAGFDLQRRQLDAQREEFKRMALVSCVAEVRNVVWSTVQSELADFKIDYPQYKDWNIGFAFLVYMVDRKRGAEPTGSTAEDAISDDVLAGAIYTIDICAEAMYQACKMYVQVVEGDSSLPPHVQNLGKRSKIVLRIINEYKLPYISRFRLPLDRLSEWELDQFVEKHMRIFGHPSHARRAGI